MRISWDDSNRFYSEGISNAVLYPKNSPGVAWNGLISVTEKGDADPTEFYIDGQKCRGRIAPAVFSGTVSAFMYPDEFRPFIGVNTGFTAQTKKSFGLCYRNNREIHLVYNALVSPSSDQYSSISDDISPVTFSWDFTTTPMATPYARPTAHIVVALDYANAGAISDLENILYGNGANGASLPNPSDVLALFDPYAILKITDNGDGTWTADGPDSAITMLDDITFQIDWASAVFIDSDSYYIRSL